VGGAGGVHHTGDAGGAGEWKWITRAGPAVASTTQQVNDRLTANSCTDVEYVERTFNLGFVTSEVTYGKATIKASELYGEWLGACGAPSWLWYIIHKRGPYVQIERMWTLSPWLSEDDQRDGFAKYVCKVEM